mmetsp:Transcript_90919/g.252974  ORF Transcript_90919/g.252974 Transcript_90919/m.252974 type:complete len:322 (+) Transcript_90919:423-1388(+)
MSEHAPRVRRRHAAVRVASTVGKATCGGGSSWRRRAATPHHTAGPNVVVVVLLLLLAEIVRRRRGGDLVLICQQEGDRRAQHRCMRAERLLRLSGRRRLAGTTRRSQHGVAELTQSGLKALIPGRSVDGDGRRFCEIAEDQPEGVVAVEVQHDFIAIEQVALFALAQCCRCIRRLLGATAHVQGVHVAQVVHEEGEAGGACATPCLDLKVLAGEGGECVLLQDLLPEIELVGAADDQRAVQVGLRRRGVRDASPFQGHVVVHAGSADFQHEDQVPFAILTVPTVVHAVLLLLLALRACPSALLGARRGVALHPLSVAQARL